MCLFKILLLFSRGGQLRPHIPKPPLNGFFVARPRAGFFTSGVLDEQSQNRQSHPRVQLDDQCHQVWPRCVGFGEIFAFLILPVVPAK